MSTKKPRVRTDAATATWDTLLHNLVAVAVLGAATGLAHVVTGGGWSWRAAEVAAVSGALAGVIAYLRTAYLRPYRAIRKQNKQGAK